MKLPAHIGSHPLKQDEEITPSIVQCNIWLILLFRGLLSTSLISAVYLPFSEKNGLNNTQAFLVASALAGAAALAEVPGGRFADLYGRKRCIVFGALLIAIGTLLSAAGYGFSLQLIAFVIMGIGWAFTEGADSALVSEQLRKLGYENTTYTKFESLKTIWLYSGSACGSVLCLLAVAAGGPRMAMWWQVPFYVLLIPIALLLKEPEQTIAANRASAQNYAIWPLLIHTVFKQKELRLLIAFCAVFAPILDLAVLLEQSYAIRVGIPLELFVVINLAGTAVGILSARLAKYCEGKNAKFVLWAAIALVFSGLGVLAIVPPVWWMIFAFAGAHVVFGMFYAVLMSYLQNLVEEDGIRATTVSIQRTVMKLFFFLTLWLNGKILDAFSLPMTILFSVVFYGGLSALVLCTFGRGKLALKM